MVRVLGVLIFLLDIGLQNYFKERGFGIANQGVGFGFLPGTGQGIAMLIFLILLIYFLISKNRRSYPFFLLVLGGLGNLLPRMVWGSVWDYIYIQILPFWFNLSDVLITAGVASYILRIDANRDTV